MLRAINWFWKSAKMSCSLSMIKERFGVEAVIDEGLKLQEEAAV